MMFVPRLCDVCPARRRFGVGRLSRAGFDRVPSGIDAAALRTPDGVSARSNPGLETGATGRGFTLIEVLMAAFVLALGVLGLAAMFAGAARQQQLASQQTRSVSVSQSADALISEKAGKIGIFGDTPSNPVNGQIYPGQRLYPGQWFVVPIELDTTTKSSFLSINPDENWSSGAPYFRETPNQQLPRLIYRAIPDAMNRILVGKTGLTDTGNPAFDQAPFSVGAPSFDDSFGVPRVLSDSIVMRVITMGYGCRNSQRYLLSELPRTITFTLHPYIENAESSDAIDPQTMEPTSIGEIHYLVGNDGPPFDIIHGRFDLEGRNPPSGSVIAVDQQWAVSDDDFAANPTNKVSTITSMWIQDVLASSSNGEDLPNSDINCDGAADWVVCNQADAEAQLFSCPLRSGPSYLDVSPPGGVNAYVLNPSDPTKATLLSDQQILVSGTGPYTIDQSATGATPTGTYVRKLETDWRFVSEVWLDSFQYRGHRLVSTSDRVWYTQDPSRPSGQRPDVAYSVLYRDLGAGAGAQYIIFTYALSPSSSTSDYVPPEQESDITAGKSPITLVEDVTLGFDKNLSKYYVEVEKLGGKAWVVQPGQIIIFAGDGSKNPAIIGADSPVTVQSRREYNGMLRGYLESAPRVGNRSLLEASSPNTKFNVWALQPSVKSLDSKKSEWGLRPIEARLFEVYSN